MWNEISCVKKQFSNIQLILQLIHLQLCPDFTLTNNFIRILNSNYSFVDVNVDVSYHNSHKFFEKVNNSKLDTTDSKESMIFIFPFFAYFILSFSEKIKTWSDNQNNPPSNIFLYWLFCKTSSTYCALWRCLAKTSMFPVSPSFSP